MGIEVFAKLANTDEISRLVHAFIDKEVWEKPVNFEKYREVFTTKEWNSLKHGFSHLVEKCQKANFSESALKSYFASLNIDIPDHVQSSIIECFEGRSDQLKTFLLEKCNEVSGTGEVLKDVDWSVSVVMGSDSMSNMKQPLMSLALCTSGDQGDKTHNFEFSQDELRTMIASMDAAYRSSLQFIS